MARTVTGVTLALGLWAMAFAAEAATIWSGPKITFSHAAGANPNDPASQDRMTPAVWITRGNTMGIFNARTETFYSGSSPADTEWAYGTTANLTNLTFRPWVAWNGSNPPGSVGRDAVVHLISEDIYIDIKFTEWGGTGGRFAYQRSTPSGGPQPQTTSYQGLWWASPANSESGWGLNITHQGDILFMTWFTYDTDGRGMWLVMSSGNRTAPGTYSGALYRTSGPPFNRVPWTGAVTVTQVGTATFTFSGADNGTFAYTVDGISQTKAIMRQVYSSPVPTCLVGGTAGATPSYQDLWWASPANSESGWGLNITHQGDILFMTWFTYDTDGRGMWLVMSNGNRTAAGTYSGALYRTSGPPFNRSPWTGAVTVTQVGTGTFTFSGASNGTFAYTVDGFSQTKAITRQAYSAPLTACNVP
jgi:hypothetical protein